MSSANQVSKTNRLNIPIPLVIVPVMLLLGPIILAAVFIVFGLYSVVTGGEKIAASDANPIHQGPSELMFYLFLFVALIALSVFTGFLVWLFQKKLAPNPPKEDS